MCVHVIQKESLKVSDHYPIEVELTGKLYKYASKFIVLFHKLRHIFTGKPNLLSAVCN